MGRGVPLHEHYSLLPMIIFLPGRVVAEGYFYQLEANGALACR